VVKTIFEKGMPGRSGVALPDIQSVKGDIGVPAHLKRKSKARLPEVSESEAVRHYIELSAKNYHVDKGFYPLGSCTMKYNPRINEEIASLSGFADLHPEQPEETIQGALQVYYELEKLMSEISGFPAISLQPAAGAHGELTGMLVVRAYLEKQGYAKKTVLIPDSAHGTNPATAALAGYQVVQVASGKDGRVDFEDFEKKLNGDTAAMMITNPNTLGLYENKITKIAEKIHSVNALLYMDGANFNAIIGKIKPADLGVDVMHFNTHKTFSTPHGGGGPGAGPIGVCKKLEPFLPVPRVIKNPDGGFSWDYHRGDSIGKVHGYFGNFLVLLKAYSYILMIGRENLSQISSDAVLNANYLSHLLSGVWEQPYEGPVAHEFVLSAKKLKAFNIKALDVAKRLIEMGFHPPTIYFPSIVSEALMIEPTESETKETLETFTKAMTQIAHEAEFSPEKLHEAPVNTPVRRLDEAKAAKELKVKAI
jgi:glycine dehydrogenase subunit 2